jgi:hypothetical protein
MPAPTDQVFSGAAKVAAHNALVTLLGSGALLRVRDSADVLLVQYTLSNPVGTVNGTTGQLTITAPAAVNPTAAGTAAYGELCTSGGTVHFSLPAQAGTTPVARKLVLNSLAVVTTAPVNVLGLTIG